MKTTIWGISVILMLTSCTTAQILTTASTIAGVVCRHATNITDDQGLIVGVRIAAGILGQDCRSPGMITVPLERPAAVAAARELRPGDRIEVEAEPQAESVGPPMVVALKIRRVG